MPTIDIQPHIEEQITEITKTATFLRSREDAFSEARRANNLELCSALETGPARYLLKQSSWQLTILLCSVFDTDTDERVTLRKFASKANASSDYTALESKHAEVLGLLREFRNAKIAHLIPKLAKQMKTDLWLHDVLNLANDVEDLVEKITNRNLARADNAWHDECLKFWRSIS